MSNKVNCPQCGANIILDDLLEKQILEKHQASLALAAETQNELLRQEKKKLEQQQVEFEEKAKAAREEYKAKLAADRKAMMTEVQTKVNEDFRLKIENLEKLLAVKEEKLSAAQKSELDSIRKAKELDERQKELELEMEKKINASLAAEKEKIEAEANAQIQKALEEVSRKNAEIKEKELQFLKQKVDLDDRSQGVELEVLRKLEGERQKIKAEAIKATEGRHRFEIQESEKTINDLKRIIDDLNLKITEGSQQKRGEVAEIEIENVLKATFLNDLVEAVPKGVRGADVLQTVRNQFGRECGTIIIEAKRTKAWSQGWINKLKDDQREINADIALLVTSTMPKESERFIFLDGVWVTDFETFSDLVTVLRMNLIEISRVRTVKNQKESKLNDVYEYVTGNDFRQKVGAVMDTLLHMKNDLIVEKTSIQKLWSKREKHIESIINATTRVSGDIDAILGTTAKEFADEKDTFPSTKPA